MFADVFEQPSLNGRVTAGRATSRLADATLADGRLATYYSDDRAMRERRPILRVSAVDGSTPRRPAAWWACCGRRRWWALGMTPISSTRPPSSAA